jgi:hypothetical protein
MSDLEMEKYAIGIGEVSGEKLIELFQNLEMNRGDIISLLTDKLLLVNKKREAIIDDIVKVFNNQ